MVLQANLLSIDKFDKLEKFKITLVKEWLADVNSVIVRVDEGRPKKFGFDVEPFQAKFRGYFSNIS